jgi:hypothetical protein
LLGGKSVYYYGVRRDNTMWDLWNWKKWTPEEKTGGRLYLTAVLIASSLMIGGYQIHKIDTKKDFQIKIQDINQNEIPEVFYEIKGNKYFLSIDGKNLEKELK